jgi:hypothetical protein
MESKKVLIAEDSSVIQNLTKKILQIQNYQIYSAKNGLEVLSMLENDYYDIILMDINMPKMDGMECAEKVRALNDPKKSQIPIVAITGNARNYTMEEFQKVGINEFLQKPLNFDSLVETVKNLTS